MVSRGYDVGLIGMGVMGANLVLNIADHGFSVVVYDATAEKTREFIQQEVGNRKIKAAGTLRELVALLRRPRAVILLVPAGTPVDAVIGDLMPYFETGDLLIDGGNSHFTDTNRREQALAEKGLLFMGMGVSGGEYGARHGPSLMPGGPREGYERVGAILQATAARVNGDPCVTYLGSSSAGHYVKMVHNGIEYGIMAAYAEGLNILRHANVGKQQRTADAETTPLRHPEHYPYDLNLADIAEVWRRGSVIASWLLDLTAIALIDNPDLAKFAGRVSDSGEGRWTVMAAIDESVPAPVLSAALYERFSSRGEADFADRVLSALRYEFGGHEEKAAPKKGGA